MRRLVRNQECSCALVVLGASASLLGEPARMLSLHACSVWMVCWRDRRTVCLACHAASKERETGWGECGLELLKSLRRRVVAAGLLHLVSSIHGRASHVEFISCGVSRSRCASAAAEEQLAIELRANIKRACTIARISRVRVGRQTTEDWKKKLGNQPPRLCYAQAATGGLHGHGLNSARDYGVLGLPAGRAGRCARWV